MAGSAVRPARQQLGQAPRLLGIGPEDLAHPEARQGGIDLGAPAQDLLDVEPVLGSVEDRLADDEVLGPDAEQSRRLAELLSGGPDGSPDRVR